MVILDLFSYDICVATPDHFFSYLSNLTLDTSHNIKLIIDQARSALSHHKLGRNDTLFLIAKFWCLCCL